MVIFLFSLSFNTKYAVDIFVNSKSLIYYRLESNFEQIQIQILNFSGLV